MSVRLTLTLLTIFCLPACTTVDLADMAKSPTTSVNRPSVQKNVVQRAADRLYAAFTQKGWSESESRNRMQSAARVLLKGLPEQTETEGGYVTQVQNLNTVKADIVTASAHVEQTTKAAEVFLAMASDDTALKTELDYLERALLAAREAESTFTAALTKFDAEVSVVPFTAKIDSLRNVTNIFGDRVRDDAVQPVVPAS